MCVSHCVICNNNNIMKWLSPPSPRGSHVKSDFTLTIIKQSLLSLYTWYLPLDFSSCDLVTVYPNRIRSNGIPLLQVSSNQNAGGRSKSTQEPRNNGAIILNHLRMHHGLSTHSCLLHFRSASRHPSATQGATITPSIQPTKPMSTRYLPPLTSAINGSK